MTSYICISKGPGEINGLHVIQTTITNSLNWNTLILQNLSKEIFLDTKNILNFSYVFD